MNTLDTIALAKAADKLANGLPVLPVGIHVVDMTVTLHVKGTVTKSADHDYTPTVAIPLKTTLALALHYAGVTRERAKAIITQAMTEALNTGTEARLTDWLADVDEAMNHVQDITDALPKQIKTGGVRTKLILEVIEPVVAA